MTAGSRPGIGVSTTEVFDVETGEALITQLRDTINLLSINLQSKQSGIYNVHETLTDGVIYDEYPVNERNAKPTYRKLVLLGALPNASAKRVAHGIMITPGFAVISLYGGANRYNSSGTFMEAIPLPLGSPGAGSPVSIRIDGRDVIVTTAIDRSSFTRTWVIIEYIKV